MYGCASFPDVGQEVEVFLGFNENNLEVLCRKHLMRWFWVST